MRKTGVWFLVLLLALALTVVGAYAAITVTVSKYQKVGNERLRDGTIGIEATTLSQATGASLTPTDFGLAGIRHIEIGPHNGYVFRYDITNQKIYVVSHTNQEGATTAFGIVGATPPFRVWGY